MLLQSKAPPPQGATAPSSGRAPRLSRARPTDPPRDVRARGWLAGPQATPVAAPSSSDPQRQQQQQQQQQQQSLQGKPSPLPASHDQAVRQAQLAAERALAAGLRLLEVEVPPVAITAVAGDGDGQREMNESLRLLRRFLGAPVFRDRAARVRVLFGDASEVAVATSGATLDPAAGRARTEAAFPRDAPGEPPFGVGFLTRPNVLWSLTGVNFDGWSAVSQVEEADEVLVVAYPTFNAKEELKAAREVWEACCLPANAGQGGGGGDKAAAAKADNRTDIAAAAKSDGGGSSGSKGARRALIVFNGELEKLREGYYPPLFFRDLAAIAREWLPLMETVYSVRNFRGSRPAALVRSYPGEWTLYRRDPLAEEAGGGGDGAAGAVAVWSSARRPSLKEVAMELLPASDAALADALEAAGGGGGGGSRR